MLDHIKMLSQMDITKDAQCDTPFLEWLSEACVEPRMHCYSSQM